MELCFHPIIGHAASRHKAVQYSRTARHHALLLDGKKGIGKASFAGQLADALLSGKPFQDHYVPEPEHPKTRLLQNGGHPDFLLIEATHFGLKSGQIPTEALDSIHQFVQRQGTSPHRIVLIDALDDCVPNLCHGLLKLLEEPPQGVIFLLIVHQIGRILDTIRSRALRIHFPALTDDEMRQCLPRLPLGENPPETETLIALSEGAPGRAVALAEADIDGLLMRFTEYLTSPEMNGVRNRALINFICQKKYHQLPAWKYLNIWLCRQILRQRLDQGTNPAIKSAQALCAAFHDTCKGAILHEHIQDNLALLHTIQQPPAYLDAEQTIQSLLFRWHGLIHQSKH